MCRGHRIKKGMMCTAQISEPGGDKGSGLDLGEPRPKEVGGGNGHKNRGWKNILTDPPSKNI